MQQEKTKQEEIVEIPHEKFDPFDKYADVWREVAKRYESEIDVLLSNHGMFDYKMMLKEFQELRKTSPKLQPQAGMLFISDSSMFNWSFGYIINVQSHRVREFFMNGKPKKTSVLRHYMLTVDKYGNMITVEYNVDAEGVAHFPYYIYLSDRGGKPSEWLKTAHEIAVQQETERRSQIMQITVGMWEDMLNKIELLENKIEENERDLCDNYRRIYNSLEE